MVSKGGSLRYRSHDVPTMFLPNHGLSWFDMMMVGPIKTLTDLRRIEAAVRVACNDCGFVRMIDREQLINHCQFHRSSLDWDAVRASLPGWNGNCLSRDTRVDALPFSQDRVALRRRRAETILMNLALNVLKSAAYRADTQAISTPEVRLALRVLYPYLADDTLLRRFWALATSDRGISDSCHPTIARIVGALGERGHAVAAEFLGTPSA